MNAGLNYTLTKPLGRGKVDIDRDKDFGLSLCLVWMLKESLKKDTMWCESWIPCFSYSRFWSLLIKENQYMKWLVLMLHLTISCNFHHRCKTLNCELLVKKGWRSSQLCKVGNIYGSFLFQIGSELRGITLDWIINVAMIM